MAVSSKLNNNLHQISFFVYAAVPCAIFLLDHFQFLLRQLRLRRNNLQEGKATLRKEESHTSGFVLLYLTTLIDTLKNHLESSTIFQFRLLEGLQEEEINGRKDSTAQKSSPVKPLKLGHFLKEQNQSKSGVKKKVQNNSCFGVILTLDLVSILHGDIDTRTRVNFKGSKIDEISFVIYYGLFLNRFNDPNIVFGLNNLASSSKYNFVTVVPLERNRFWFKKGPHARSDFLGEGGVFPRQNSGEVDEEETENDLTRRWRKGLQRK
ncbi:hypothetical protein GQR58_026186 [Nymphon striatum]|nr:hypothetical protein GQR58_026186 [Nymphon striatum]